MANPQLENGYIRIANEIQDALCKFRIPGECRQILDCIFRKTYGYQKKEDWISNSQIVEMTGMDKGNAARSLSKAITHKLVIVSDNKLSLNKNYNEWISFTGNHYNPKPKGLSQVTTPVIASDNRVIASDNKKLSQVTVTIDNKDNIQKTILQKTGKFIAPSLLEEDFIYISKYYSDLFNRNIPISFVKNKYDDMLLWIEGNPGNPKLKGRDWKKTLMRFVKDDAIKIVERSKGDSTKRAVDATNL